MKRLTREDCFDNPLDALHVGDAFLRLEKAYNEIWNAYKRAKKPIHMDDEGHPVYHISLNGYDVRLSLAESMGFTVVKHINVSQKRVDK